MKVLLIGSGGREHALAWKIAQSPLLDQLLIAPGNPGTAHHGRNIPFAASSIPQLVDIAQRERVGLVVIGPEAPLAAGLADACVAAGIPVFGPSAAAARIESSKIFAKQLMREAGIPTAEAHEFDDPAEATRFVRSSGKAWVVKADGLAAGKGVIVAEDVDATIRAIDQIMATGAGRKLLLEERLSGPEISLLALCDGTNLLPLPPARDHKRLLDGDLGPNTGGMGAVAPIALDDATFTAIVEQIMEPAVRALAAAGTPFHGALYAGIMLTQQGPYALEFNARFGDPETQAILPLIEGDFLAALLACAAGGRQSGGLQPNLLRWRTGAAACVVLAAGGYPEAPLQGDPIGGLEAIDEPGVFVFHAGTDWNEGRIVTSGGRVLGITGTGSTLASALARAYSVIDGIRFDGMQYRHDIGTTKEQSMITLYDAKSGAALGTLNETQLQFLIDNLEEEWAGDTDYFFHQPTIELLESRGADPAIITVLSKAIAATGDADIRWGRS